ncbi:MAG: DUF1016 family protein [Bacilli bacterium]|nr:DUF1016 family protein [Bacilli bacterium]
MENIIDPAYAQWINQLKNEYRQTQIKAAIRVNEQLIRFYYRLGEEITKRGYESTYGSAFYEKLSADIRKEIPDAKGFSSTNLHYMSAFYRRYSPLLEVLLQAAKSSESALVPTLPENFLQVAGKLFAIPWGHHQIILNRTRSLEEALYYVSECLENGWSRAILTNFIKSDLFHRQGKAITNFAYALPDSTSDLAQQITKDPYQFNFLSIGKKYDEKQLKDALIDNIERFLLELGDGFAYLGREKRIQIGQEEKFMDMLFYNLNLRCYVVVEIKVDKLGSENLGQLGLYVTAVNNQLKKEWDNPTIGLLIVGEKDDVVAKYAVEMMKPPIGIAEYQLTGVLPKELQSDLPSIEEIEEGIKR